MARALDETRIVGVPTTIPFLRRVMDDPTFQAGEAHTDFLAVSGQQAALSQQPSAVNS